MLLGSGKREAALSMTGRAGECRAIGQILNLADETSLRALAAVPPATQHRQQRLA
jgi:hypothetical protein